MAFKDLSQTEIDGLLSRERVMRIGLEADGELFLVPLGYRWHRNAFYAMTTRGRKTSMAAVNPNVSFQVDTSATTGQYSWHSVSGEGTFEVVTDQDEIETVSPLLVAQFADMPEWMQSEYAVKKDRGEVVIVRVRPSRMTGRKSEPA